LKAVELLNLELIVLELPEHLALNSVPPAGVHCEHLFTSCFQFYEQDNRAITMRRNFLFAARHGVFTPRFFSTTIVRPAINKIVSSAQEAIQDMQSDTTVLVGGFGFSGVPNTLINALRDRSDLGNFTVVSNNAGMPGVGLGQLLETKQIGTMVASYIGDNKVFEQMYLKGQLSLQLTPQGTIAEKCAAGAAGVPAFYTPAAYGTIGMSPKISLRQKGETGGNAI
jgi:3-oxoacid CoA-transferase